MAVETQKPKLTIGPIPETQDVFPLSRVASIVGELIANVEKVIVGQHN